MGRLRTFIAVELEPESNTRTGGSGENDRVEAEYRHRW